MSRTFANVAGVLAAIVAVLLLYVEIDAVAGHHHVPEVARVVMHILAVMLGSAYFMRRTLDRVMTEYQQDHPPVDEMHIARAAAKLVTDELKTEIKNAVDAAYRAGMVMGAAHSERSNGHSGGYPKLAHIPER